MADDPVIEVHDGRDIEIQAEELGLETPDSFAILPENYFSAESVDDLRVNEEALTIEKLTKEEGLEPDKIVDSSEQPVSHYWSVETVGPIIHFTAEFLTENWQGVLTIISMIKTHYALQRISSAEFSFSVEQPDGTTVQVEYEGDPEQLDDVIDTLEKYRDEDTEGSGSTDSNNESSDDEQEPDNARDNDEEPESA